IHEVAQVVAAASITGGAAVSVATTIKLARVLLLGVAFWASVRLDQRLERDPLSSATRARKVSLIPWFVVVFLIAVAVRSSGIVPPEALTGIDAAATTLLAAGMFGLGLGINVRQLFPLPMAVLGVATVSTLIGVTVPFGLILLLY
nr:putative sulfate exporter family transporter [Actinomycetales bacterium]